MSKNQTPEVAGFGTRMATLRRSVGLTQEQLAARIEVSRRMVAYYEAETEHPPTQILPRLAHVFGVSTDALLLGTVPVERAALRHSRTSMSKDSVPYPTVMGTHGASRVREVLHEDDIRIVQGDSRHALEDLPTGTFQCCITSPPYWGLRDYGINGQIGAENDPDVYIADLVAIFREVRRALRDDGTLWLNIGDSYTSGDRRWRAPDRKNAGRAMTYRPPTPKGLKPKDLIGIPWRLALALQSDGWFLRSDIIWNKPNCQPESVKDRPTRAHEYVFLMSKTESYFYDFAAIREASTNGDESKNRRTVWNINTNGFHGAHFAVFPPELVRLCLLAGSKPDSSVLDPFFGSGTVGLVCRDYGRHCLGIELNPEYIKIAVGRIQETGLRLPLYAVPNSH
jgi:site-specific DNA-methyltransferase (adenine-specific)/site-specific DNA-methyltransferase (cytosine-N4-specific)